MIKAIRFNSRMTINIVLLIIVGLLFTLPLFIHPNSEFSGADSKAQELISEVDATYEPWFKPLWSPPSSEVESAIFAIQAAVGSGIVFFVLGYFIGSKRSGNQKK